MPTYSAIMRPTSAGRLWSLEPPTQAAAQGLLALESFFSRTVAPVAPSISLSSTSMCELPANAPPQMRAAPETMRMSVTLALIQSVPSRRTSAALPLSTDAQSFLSFSAWTAPDWHSRVGVGIVLGDLGRGLEIVDRDHADSAWPARGRQAARPPWRCLRPGPRRWSPARRRP